MAVPLIMWMTPRDHHTASRTVSTLGAVAIVVTLVFLPWGRDNPDGARPGLLAAAVAAFVAMVVISAAAWFFDEGTRWAWACCPLVAVVTIVLLDLATYDSSTAAQVFFVLPTLYAGSLLPRQGAALLTGACVVGEAVVVVVLLPVREAAVDLGYLAAVLVTVATLLVRLAERQATLVAELERRAGTDALTGLATRYAFDEVSVQALEAGSGTAGTALILLDVDRFKSVNDRFGHPGGDEVLVQLSRLLVEGARSGDVVCRIGGDEVAVLLPGCPVEVARWRAEEMVRRVHDHGFYLGLGSVARISVSAGVAHSPTHAQTFTELYAAADSALYRAKQAGRDRVEVLAA